MAFQLVPVGRSMTDDAAPTPYAEVVRHAIRLGHGEFDWIIVGEAPVLFAPDRLRILADCDRDLLAAAADRDGAVVLLTGPRSKVSRVFVSPNLLPAFGVPETLAVARDREIPPMLRTLAGSQPIALRLALDGDPRPSLGDRQSSRRATPPIDRPRAHPSHPTTTWSRAGQGHAGADPRQAPRRLTGRELNPESFQLDGESADGPPTRPR